MSNTIYILYNNSAGYPPYDFSFYHSYENAQRAKTNKERWPDEYCIVAVDEGTID